MGWEYGLEELAAVTGAIPATGAKVFTGVSTDTRTLRPGDVFFALKGERFDGNQFVEKALDGGAVAAVASNPPETERTSCLIVPDALAALQAFAAHHRMMHDIPVIAITGSCGKTSAKDFTAALLETRGPVTKTRGNLNNEIGCPLSLLRIDEDTHRAIIEMGANHAGEIARLCELARPTEAAITLVAPAHLEGFGSVEKVAEAKAEIVEGLAEDGCFYVNTDNPWCVAIAEGFAGEKVRFGKEGDVSLRSCAFDRGGELRLEIDPVGPLRLPLPIRAQATNILLAVAIGLRHGVTDFEEPLRAACRASTRFRVERIGPFEVMDDTYNANPASMKAALEALGERPTTGVRIAALGEMLELGDAATGLHGEVGEEAAALGVTHLFARGPHARDMITAARHAGVVHAEAIDDHPAMARAIQSAAPGGGLLLVKGSRGMRMERVIEELRRLFDSHATPPEDDG